MSSAYEVRFDPVALTALDETATYIREDSGPGRAAKWLEAMRRGIRELGSAPRAYPVACIRRGRPIRSKRIMSHRVFFFIEDAEGIVFIIDVVHTARETRLAEYRDPTGPLP